MKKVKQILSPHYAFLSSYSFAFHLPLIRDNTGKNSSTPHWRLREKKIILYMMLLKCYSKNFLQPFKIVLLNIVLKLIRRTIYIIVNNNYNFSKRCIYSRVVSDSYGKFTKVQWTKRVVFDLLLFYAFSFLFLFFSIRSLLFSSSITGNYMY